MVCRSRCHPWKRDESVVATCHFDKNEMRQQICRQICMEFVVPTALGSSAHFGLDVFHIVAAGSGGFGGGRTQMPRVLLRIGERIGRGDDCRHGRCRRTGWAKNIVTARNSHAARDSQL